LGVTAADVVDAIERVRASAGSATVAAYRAGRDGEAAGSDPGLAVLIQPMIDARVAGVAFSADPVTGDRASVVVTAVAGLGSTLVDGLADADEWLVREGRASPRRAPVRVLDEALATQVAALARRVAERAGTPQDIEWAHDGADLWLLQARPLTGLPPEVAWTTDAPGVFTRNFRFGEWIAGPVTPLFESWLLTTMEERMHEVHEAEFGMRAPRPRHVVVNGWYFYSLAFLPLSGAALRRSLPGLVSRLLRRPRRGSIWMGPLARFGMPIFEREWRDDVAPAYERAVDDAARAVESADPESLVALVDRLATLAGSYFSSITVVAGSVYKSEMELARLYGRHLAPRIGGSHLDLLGGTSTPDGPGPHAVTTIDWSEPTFGETASGDADHAMTEARRAERARSRDAARERARAAIGGSGRRVRALDRLLAEADRGAQVRETQVAMWTLPWPVMRRAIARLGEALVARGLVDLAGDAYFLSRDELAEAIRGAAPASLREVVAERRQAHREAGRLAPPVWIGRAPTLVRKLILEGRSYLGAQAGEDRTLLVGVPASPGRVTGRVRVIRDPAAGEALVDGEVLVAPLTAPAWTPLFARAAAVVTDIGSAQAHASIIAREYGIPAVVGCGDATRRLVDGQLVTVDGAAGRVEAGFV
jgi:pyruvate,water dikinase